MMGATQVPLWGAECVFPPGLRTQVKRRTASPLPPPPVEA